MKSLQDLAAIRDEMKQTVNTREAAHDSIKIIVGMGTCGISAGARPVLNAFTEEVAKQNLGGVLVTQSGYLDVSGLEPVVEVVRPGTETVVYGKMDADKAKKVVEEHIKGGKVVTEYTVAALQK